MKTAGGVAGGIQAPVLPKRKKRIFDEAEKIIFYEIFILKNTSF
jgi:hypothetical protein